MNDNFVTYGTANVMVSNITYDTALDIQSRLEDIEGVTTVELTTPTSITRMRRRCSPSALTQK